MQAVYQEVTSGEAGKGVQAAEWGRSGVLERGLVYTRPVWPWLGAAREEGGPNLPGQVALLRTAVPRRGQLSATSSSHSQQPGDKSSHTVLCRAMGGDRPHVGREIVSIIAMHILKLCQIMHLSSGSRSESSFAVFHHNPGIESGTCSMPRSHFVC